MKVISESEVAQSWTTLATPWTAAHQAPPSMGFSRQEYWSGVPLPSPLINTSMCEFCGICSVIWKKKIPPSVMRKSWAISAHEAKCIGSTWVSWFCSQLRNAQMCAGVTRRTTSQCEKGRKVYFTPPEERETCEVTFSTFCQIGIMSFYEDKELTQDDIK